MIRSILVLLCCVFATGAFAQTSVPEEITGYRAIGVSYSAQAKNCNLEHSATYEARLREKLAGIGVTQNANSIMVANIGITGQKVGLLGGRCVTMVELAFVTLLSKDNIVTDNPDIRRTIDRLGSFPIVVYKNGVIKVHTQEEPAAGGPSTSAKEAALALIDILVKRLAEKRM